MTNDSVVHVIDRFMANINLSMQMWKLSTYMYYARPGTFYCHLCAITFAIFSFMNSQDAQHEQDREGFIFWHNCWHCYPFVCVVIESFDYYYLGELDEFNEVIVNVTSSHMDRRWTFCKIWSNIKQLILFCMDPTSVDFDDVSEKEKTKKFQ